MFKLLAILSPLACEVSDVKENISHLVITIINIAIIITIIITVIITLIITITIAIIITAIITIDIFLSFFIRDVLLINLLISAIFEVRQIQEAEVSHDCSYHIHMTNYYYRQFGRTLIF